MTSVNYILPFFFMYISWYQSLKWILILVIEAMWVSIPNFNQNKKMLELQRMLKQLKQEVLTLFKIKMEALKGTLKDDHNLLYILNNGHKN